MFASIPEIWVRLLLGEVGQGREGSTHRFGVVRVSGHQAASRKGCSRNVESGVEIPVLHGVPHL